MLPDRLPWGPMFDIQPLDAPFGATLRGWEPSQPLSDAETDALRKALSEHSLLLLRGQPRPSDEEFARLGRSFGELFAGGEIYGLDSESREVLRVSNELDVDGHEVERTDESEHHGEVEKDVPALGVAHLVGEHAGELWR